jgi:hypothetical protein
VRRAALAAGLRAARDNRRSEAAACALGSKLPGNGALDAVLLDLAVVADSRAAAAAAAAAAGAKLQMSLRLRIASHRVRWSQLDQVSR